MKKVVGLLACVGMLSLQILAVSPPVMAADAGQENITASDGASDAALESAESASDGVPSIQDAGPTIPVDAQPTTTQAPEIIEQAAASSLQSSLDVLNTFYQTFASFVPSTYSAASWQPMADALAQAGALLQNPQNTTAEAAQAALNALLAAENGLEMAPATGLLRETIALAQAQVAQPGQYVRTTATRLEQTLAQANALLAQGEPSQEQIDAMIAAIVNATSSLVYIPDNLESTRQAAEAILTNKDQYVPGTVAALDESLKELQAVYANPNLSQEALDQAVAALATQTGEVRRPASKEALKGGGAQGNSPAVLAQAATLPDNMEPVNEHTAQGPVDSISAPAVPAIEEAVKAPDVSTTPNQPQPVAPANESAEAIPVAGLAAGTDRMMAAAPAALEQRMRMTDAARTPAAPAAASDTFPLVAAGLVSTLGLLVGVGYALMLRKGKNSQPDTI